MTGFRNFFAAAAIAVAATVVAAPAQATPHSVIWGPGANLGVTETVKGHHSGFSVRNINPLKKALGGGFYDEVQYCSYNNPYGASANTPDGLEQSQTLTFFLFENGKDDISLFLIMDKWNDGSGSAANISVTSAGLAGTGVNVLVRDDPGDSSYAWNDATGAMNPDFRSWPCCTDGMVLGYLPDASESSWSINYSFNSYEGLNQARIWYLADAYENNPNQGFQSFQIPMNQLNTLVFRRIGETTAAVTAPAGLIFPLAALGLFAVRRRR